jgi:23S rRNA (guanine2445-N2)-methyltransferase / 23S rRNA (guanine2069-N7)-methyltransferase
MKESMASGLLYECGWHLLVAQAKMDRLPAVLIDPMTGSGTFCIEAALMAADIAPGLIRMRAASKALQDKAMIPAVLRWKNSDITLWRNLCEEAQVRRQNGLQWLLGRNPVTGNQNCHILGNDAHKGAYRLALQCRQEADMPKSAIEFHNVDCQEWKIAGHIVEGRTIVVVNPPWGLRLDIDTERSWVALKSFLREECVGAEAWILSGNKHLTRTLNMKKTRSVPLKTAAEMLRWLQYPIFKSSTINTRNNTEIISFNV